MSNQNDGVNRSDSRRASRVTLPAMYTLVRVRPQGDKRYRWTGFAYDISSSGMRFELDEALPSGSALDVRVILPGATPTTFHASGRVVRTHDDADDPGPVRMGMRFESFRLQTDCAHLKGYLAPRLTELAA